MSIAETPRGADRAQLSFYVESILTSAQRSLDDEQRATALIPTIQFYDLAELTRFQEFWSGDHGDGSASARKILKALERREPHWPCSPVPDDSALLALAGKFPNFAQVIDYVRRAAALARLSPGGPLMVAPLLLDGPPGIGKSAFARAFAAALQAPMLQFSMTQATSSFGLGGLNAQYSGGGPGYLVRSVVEHGVPDAVVVVDELDKAAIDANHNPTLPLFELLESSTAARYVDDGLQMPLNMSALRWICTSNDAALIAEPLRSRCMQFQIPAPTPEQMQAIASTVYRDIVSAGNWADHFDPELPPTVASLLAESVPRDLARVLRSTLGAAALAGRSTIRVADLPFQHRSARRRVGFV